MNTVRTIAMILTLALMSGVCAGSFPHPTATLESEPGAPSSPTTSAPLQPGQVTALRPAQGATYYVRPDGGDADQCNGQTDAPYPGSGANQNCAWDHPFRALPPGGTPRIQGGDTLIIGSGSYKMGIGAPGADNCDPDGAWDCAMPPIPSGPDAAHPTRILGAGWNAGCAQPPELWGTERANWILNLTDASNVEIACLEITDHSSCVEFHADASLACERDNPPYGPWAAIGLYAEDSSNVHLARLNIHGLAHGGVWAGRLKDWTVENVRLAANGWVGWDGDIDGDDSNAGVMLFRRWTVEWNGCAETYPGQQPTGCWGQEAGGYGDGIGTGTTGGHWIIQDSTIRYNTQDGLDLLYTRLITSSVEIRRTLAQGNAGNQIKVTGPTQIENSIIVGQCGFFEGRPGWNSGDNCRAGGDALVIDLRPGNVASVTNSTLTGEGTCLLIAACALEQTCNGSEKVHLRNDIFVGQPRLAYPAENTCFAWYDDEPPDDLLPQDPFVTDYALITATRFGNVTPCAGDHVFCDAAPGLADASLSAFDAHLAAGSPAINAGSTIGAPPDDFDGRPRDAQPDIGAYEWRQMSAWIYLPLALKTYASAAGPLPLANVTYWGYQIQAISGTVDALAASRYDMLVLEPTRTDWSSNDRLFDTREMVTRLKNSPAHDGIHRKLVIAYIDIGQAEDWRWYWTWSTGWDCAAPRPADWPGYILTCDPDGWAGDYPVAYWDPAWKNIVITGTALSSAPYGDYVSMLDEVIRDGFDGIYLDWVEGFENAEVITAAQAAGRDPAVEMIAFIRQIKAYAAARRPGFIVIQQNAAALMDGHPELFNVIDAIAQEGVWYDGVATDDWNDPAGYDAPTDPTLTGEYLGWLDQYLNAGVPVFNCEYALNYAATAYTQAHNKSYKPYVTRRSLGRLTTTPPPGY